MNFPDYRPRRMRRTEALRRMVRETRLSPEDFVYPLFVVPGSGVEKPISSLPGQFNFSVDKAVEAAQKAADLGIPAVLLFGIPEKKDAVGSEAWKDSGVVQKAIRAIKKARPGLTVMADACFCEYTDHGHCGVLHEGQLDNDASLENLARAVLSYAKAGVDVVAPSGMLDGFVGACRESLDEERFDQVAIMAYSAKYASAYYGPFREAVASAPQEGDRRGHQMDYGNVAEAVPSDTEITMLAAVVPAWAASGVPDRRPVARRTTAATPPPRLRPHPLFRSTRSWASSRNSKSSRCAAMSSTWPSESSSGRRSAKSSHRWSAMCSCRPSAS